LEAQELTRCRHRSASLSHAIGHIGHIASVMESPQSDSSALLSPDNLLSTPTVTTTPDTASSDTRCHFLRIPLELRDDIYDYVAYGEMNPGLHINLEVATEPEVHAYDQGLSQTCTRVRQEYTLRLQHRIKQMLTDKKAFYILTKCTDSEAALRAHADSRAILIAERRMSKGVWTHDDVALKLIVPFKGSYDPNVRLSKLTFVVATSAVRAYNRQVIEIGGFGGLKRINREIAYALESMERLEKIARLDVRNWWMRFWSRYSPRKDDFYSLIHSPFDVEWRKVERPDYLRQ
jgi:hypothetical protein